MSTNKLATLVKLYYQLRPIIPRGLQIHMRRKMVKQSCNQYSNVWPIDEKASTPPDNWSGWPENKKFAMILTHDVETIKGHDKCYELIKLEQNLGVKSSFNFVPQRYNVSPDLRRHLQMNGFEVGVHDLNHDGKLYKSKKIFKKRATQINDYLKEWNSVGFRSGSMHRNLEWILSLNIDYDASTFDTDPFEPQSQGSKTIFPFCVSDTQNGNGYVELSYTIPQDFTLFIILQKENIDVWKRKLDWIAKHGGMALITTHPDYMNFNKGKLSLEEYPAQHYVDLLDYVKTKYDGQYWHVLPKDMALFWKQNAMLSGADKFLSDSRDIEKA